MTALKSLLYLLLVQNFGFYVPLTFFNVGPRIETGIFAYLAFPFWPIGTLIILWCFWDFTFKGRGTPAPIDPPKELVASGLYGYVRNPIYVGVILVLLGHFLWFGSWRLLEYAGSALGITYLFVTLYEEPYLRKRFGASYEDYLRKGPRGIPRFKTPSGSHTKKSTWRSRVTQNDNEQSWFTVALRPPPDPKLSKEI